MNPDFCFFVFEGFTSSLKKEKMALLETDMASMSEWPGLHSLDPLKWFVKRQKGK